MRTSLKENNRLSNLQIQYFCEYFLFKYLTRIRIDEHKNDKILGLAKISKIGVILDITD